MGVVLFGGSRFGRSCSSVGCDGSDGVAHVMLVAGEGSDGVMFVLVVVG